MSEVVQPPTQWVKTTPDRGYEYFQYFMGVHPVGKISQNMAVRGDHVERFSCFIFLPGFRETLVRTVFNIEDGKKTIEELASRWIERLYQPRIKIGGKGGN